ncbi:P-loop containing nucleoside triphosphate hydrolases superfamily protein isoform 3 [Theobroma cacao]|uniref:Sulfotransferase n=1 Tax=Theobroma cacao TaxID=3641 RepID=A0A061DGC3_THECC|nr:P-loop containing nucleoside triphosphate hydrolases superfamily protein isoform 3 [Theobroma cacao]
MAEYICLVNKDTLIIKPPKKSPCFLRTIVLLFAMVCGVYICTICLKQINTVTKMKFQKIQVIERPSPDSNIITELESQIPSLHYPKPETFSRGECTQNPVRFFAILSMQRSGSGWFETLLNSHINVSSNGEIFSVMARRKNISTIIQTLEKVYNLDWFTSASKNECSAAVGFKWMLNQQGLMEHHKEIVEYFNHRGVSAIFLFRRNLLRRMVSVLANSYDRYAKLLNGTHKSHVHSQEEAAALSSYKPMINSTSLISDLKEVEMAAVEALEYFNSTRHMVLYYEDLVTDYTKLKDVQEFLGLPQMKLTSRQVKIHKGSLSDFVKNWDDVNKTLNGTEYESFLRADY